MERSKNIKLWILFEENCMASGRGGKGQKHSAYQVSVTRNTTAAATALGVPGLCLSLSILLKTTGVILS